MLKGAMMVPIRKKMGPGWEHVLVVVRLQTEPSPSASEGRRQIPDQLRRG